MLRSESTFRDYLLVRITTEHVWQLLLSMYALVYIQELTEFQIYALVESVAGLVVEIVKLCRTRGTSAQLTDPLLHTAGPELANAPEPEIMDFFYTTLKVLSCSNKTG